MLPVPPGIRADYDHGQNFLLDEAVLDREVEYAGVGPDDHVLEIGPGIAHLTRKLTEKAAHVHVIEIDPQFRPLLEALAEEAGNLTLHWGDATAIDWPQVNIVVANLPYRQSLPLIFRMLETESIERVVVIIQERLARRLAARPGQNGYSRISVALQRTAAARVLEVVRDRLFSPPPKVDSAMLRFHRIRPRFVQSDEDYSRNCLDYLFLRRESSLEGATTGLEPEKAVRQALEAMPEAVRSNRIAAQAPESLGRFAELAFQAGVRIPEVTATDKQKSQQLYGEPVAVTTAAGRGKGRKNATKK